MSLAILGTYKRTDGAVYIAVASGANAKGGKQVTVKRTPGATAPWCCLTCLSNDCRHIDAGLSFYEAFSDTIPWGQGKITSEGQIAPETGYTRESAPSQEPT